MKKKSKSKSSNANSSANTSANADATNAQEAHEAIRPTDVNVLDVSEELGAREGKMYCLIRRNTLKVVWHLRSIFPLMQV